MRLEIMAAMAVACLAATSAMAQTQASREIRLDLAEAAGPVDRFYDLSIGSDYPGTLIRDDSQAQLVTTVGELGFRYIRFHDIFHDVLGTVGKVDGKVVYDWTKLDKLYDELLAKRINRSSNWALLPTR